MPGSIDAGAVAKIHAACEEALADAAAASAPCCATLEAWRADVGAEEGAALYRDRRAANEAADRPRAVMDELKAEVLARRQEDMLSIIRSSPGWGYEQGSTGKTGTLRVRDGGGGDAPGAGPLAHVSSAPGGAVTEALWPRVHSMLGFCGGDIAEGRQRWRERYIVLTPGTLECYRKVGGAESLSSPAAAARRGITGLERTLSRKLADVSRVVPRNVLSSVERLQGTPTPRGGDEEAEPTAFFEVHFRNQHDAYKMDILCIQADNPVDADAWMKQILELRVTAVESTLAEDAEKSQRLLDELEEAFNELNTAINPWLEKKALFPAALRVAETCCAELNKGPCADFAAKQTQLRGEPQSSTMWDIKPKYQSETGWQEAITTLNRMNEDEEGQHLPTSLEKHMLGCIDSIYATHRAKHGRDVPLGADELFPIFVFVLVNSEVSQMPTFIEMMSRNLDQTSKGAYYSITGHAAIGFVNHQLSLPSEPEPEPEPPSGAAAPQLEPEPEPEPSASDVQRLDFRTIDEDAELVDGQAFLLDIQSEMLGVHGRRSCTFNGRKIAIEAGPDGDATTLDTAPVRVVLTYKPQRAFMLQVGGKLSHFVVEDAAQFESIVNAVRWQIAEAQMDSPATSPALKSSLRASRASMRASAQLRSSGQQPFRTSSRESDGMVAEWDRPTILDNLTTGTAVDLYREHGERWVAAEVMSVDAGEVSVKETETGKVHDHIDITTQSKNGWSVIRVTSSSPRMTSRSDPKSEKVKLIFDMADIDGDKYLKHSDCVALAKMTEGEQAEMSEAAYRGFCAKVGADPAVGLTQQALYRVYCELHLGNLEADYRKIGLNEPIRALLTRLTSDDKQRSPPEDVKIVNIRCAHARNREARTAALVLKERLQLESPNPFVKLKAIVLLDTLFDTGTEDFRESARLLCHEQVKDDMWYGQQDASNPQNPGKAAQMIRAKAESLDGKLRSKPSAHLSPIPRSTILRPTFLMADTVPRENEDIDLYLGLVLSWMGMTESEQQEWRAAHGTAARWEMIKTHAAEFDFDEALFKHDLAQQILAELGDATEGAKEAAHRLAFTMTCKEHELRHQTVAEAVADALNVAVYGTESAYEDGKKQFTQYRMEFTLFSASWAVDTRWSGVLELEKQIRAAFSDRPKQQRDLPTLKERTKDAQRTQDVHKGKK